jgi:hypothetical protein
VILADGGVVEVPGDPEFIDRLVEEAVVVLGLPENPLEGEELVALTLAHSPDGAAGALTQVVHDLKTRDLESRW